VWLSYTLLSVLMLAGMFLISVILLQRGRGGGLAGGFGGLAGQSAFGTRAGHKFTVITVVTVVIWVGLACAASYALRLI
jgi:preprotein translocase subunit SecG